MKEVIAMIKLCIFDLDGTVADTLTSITYFANNALKKYGFEPFSEDDYRYFVGDGADLLIRRITEKSGGNDDDYKKIKAEYMKTYNAESMEYDASKEALISMTKALALKYQPHVNVKCVCPGWIETDMTKQNGEEINRFFLSKICKGRFGKRRRLPRWFGSYVMRIRTSSVVRRSAWTEGSRTSKQDSVWEKGPVRNF